MDDDSILKGAFDVRNGLEADLARIERARELRDRSGGRFGLDEHVDELEDELRDVLSIGTSITVEVLLCTGGPASGVDFECSIGRHGLELIRAKAWYAWWSTPQFVPLDDDLAEKLFDVWGLESTEVSQ